MNNKMELLAWNRESTMNDSFPIFKSYWNTNQDWYTAHLLVDGSYLVHRSILISGSVQLFLLLICSAS